MLYFLDKQKGIHVSRDGEIRIRPQLSRRRESTTEAHGGESLTRQVNEPAAYWVLT